MTSLHVCTITFEWYPFEVRSLRQVEAAVSAGHKVDVICLRNLHEKKYEEYPGVRVYRLPISRSYDSSMSTTIFQWCWFLLLAATKLTHLQIKNRYQVVHVHNMPDFLVFAAWFPKLFGAKVILDVQDVSPELMAAKVHRKGLLRRIVIRLAQWQERLSIAFAHDVVTTGDPFMQILLKRGVPREKITSMHNSADPRLGIEVAADKLVDFVVHGDVGIIPYGFDGFEEYVLPTKAYEYAWRRECLETN